MVMGKTFPRVLELLKKEVPRNCSRNEFCRITGINPNSFDRYVAGISEPTKSTLKKLADYFDVSETFLRGEEELGLPATLKLLDFYFDFLESLPESRQGQAMLFSKLWFEENWYRLTTRLRAEPEAERALLLKKLNSYIDKCIEIKGKFRDWQIETGGILGEWLPNEQDIVMRLDNEQTTDTVSIYASPSGKAWKKSYRPAPVKPDEEKQEK